MTQVHTLLSLRFDCKCAEYYSLAGLSRPCLIAILTHIQDLDPVEKSQIQIHELKGEVDLPESGLPNSYLFKRLGVYLVEVESLGFNFHIPPIRSTSVTVPNYSALTFWSKLGSALRY